MCPDTPPTIAGAWFGRWHSPSGPGGNPGQGPPGTRTLDGTDTKRNPQGTPRGQLLPCEAEEGEAASYKQSKYSYIHLAPSILPPLMHAPAHCCLLGSPVWSVLRRNCSCQAPQGWSGCQDKVLPLMLQRYARKAEEGKVQGPLRCLKSRFLCLVLPSLSSLDSNRSILVKPARKGVHSQVPS